MNKLSFRKELYPKIVLLKAAYQFTDRAYLHLDADEEYYHVTIWPKDGNDAIAPSDFDNEMLAQSWRHEIYQQTRNIRELILSRAIGTAVMTDREMVDEDPDLPTDDFTEDEILKDWFADEN